MDGFATKPWPSRNCVYNINLRQSEARFQRERCRVEKEIRGLERVYKQNVRKLNAAQRGVITMLGHDPYPNCDRDHVLFEHNQPGFCYRRDGQPRRFPSLLESKTRKIIHDLEGKEGLLTKPASNIISDSPMMAEVLSSPEIVEILCDLRTTAVLISDESLFSQFASSLMSSPDSPLSYKGESPMDCLLQYRKHLIQEFFDQLRIQLEIRTCPTAEETGLNSDAMDESGKSTSEKTPTETFLHQRAPSKEWNEAVIERLRKAKVEEEKENGGGGKEEDISLLESLALLPFAITVNPEDNLVMTPNTASRLISSTTSATSRAVPPPSNTITEITATHTLTDLASSPTVQLKPTVLSRPRASSKPKRNEFDNFVKRLVTQVENVAEIGKHMGQLQKRKLQFDSVANPLVRLLRKKSLFSSLTEDDLLFYEYDGGRRDAESTIARGLNINQPRPGGFTFRVPSRSENGGGVENETVSKSGRPLTRESALSAASELNSALIQPGFCACSPRSLKRLCCSACNAKMREQCNEAQDRDRKDSEAAGINSWKIPGLSDGWVKNYQTDSKAHHLLTSVPLTIRKNYAAFSNPMSLKYQDDLLESSYNLAGSRTPVRPGAPTPTGQRKNLLPEVNKLIASRESKNKGIKAVNDRRSRATLKSSINTRTSPLLDKGGTWTLKVDRMDITRLRHELESSNVREKLAKLEKAVLGDLSGPGMTSLN